MSRPPRLTADEFLEKIEQAPSYAIVLNPVYDELELIVRDDAGEVQGYLGPDPDKTNPIGLWSFLDKLEKRVKIDAANGKTRVPDSEAE
jgi:hypothetical protein